MQCYLDWVVFVESKHAYTIFSSGKPHSCSFKFVKTLINNINLWDCMKYIFQNKHAFLDYEMCFGMPGPYCGFLMCFSWLRNIGCWWQGIDWILSSAESSNICLFDSREFQIIYLWSYISIVSMVNETLFAWLHSLVSNSVPHPTVLIGKIISFSNWQWIYLYSFTYPSPALQLIVESWLWIFALI